MNFLHGIQLVIILSTLFFLVLGLTPVFQKLLAAPLPDKIRKIFGEHVQREMNSRTYLMSLIAFHILGFFILFFMQIFQHVLPLNPNQLPAVTWDLAINTAVSFITNTNWQAYSGETSMSHFTQMLGLGVQNFLSAAVGICGVLVLVRGLTRSQTRLIGNFWEDLIKSTLFILLPLSFVLTPILMSQGIPQTFEGKAKIVQRDQSPHLMQDIPVGPVASQVAIKQLGTNGGGYYGVNSAHPLENPTPVSNFFQLLAILLIPAILVLVFGRMIGDVRHGRALFITMVLFLALGLWGSFWSEFNYGTLEGKETRFGIFGSTVWSVFTTAASNGSVNAMHDSMSPLSGGIQLFNMMLGEVIFGGVGSGLYGMVLFVVLSVFLSGLMVGRSPEYQGKRIETPEMIATVIALFLPSLVVLIGTAVTLTYPTALKSLGNPGVHGFSEIVYAWTSAANNNGSAFGGLNANTPFFNIGLSIAMIIGRFGVLIPVIYISGRLAQKIKAPKTSGTFSTHSPLFIVLLFFVIVLVGGLTFFPTLTLGPILEHFMLISKKV